MCNRDMVVGCSGNNWGNMGNNRGCMGNMGNDRGGMGNNRGCMGNVCNSRSSMGNKRGRVGNNSWSVMVMDSKSGSLGNRGVNDNGGRGSSMYCGVASMAMTHSVGDNRGRCVHCGMPDPMRDNWSNGKRGCN